MIVTTIYGNEVGRQPGAVRPRLLDRQEDNQWQIQSV
jgi:hypothetical protein